MALMALGWLWWRLVTAGPPWRRGLVSGGHFVTSTVTLYGGRGAWWHRPSLCVAGVALGTGLAGWHVVTFTVTLCGGRGTWWHRPSFCCGFSAATPQYFAWQAWRLVTSTIALCGGRGANWFLSRVISCWESGSVVRAGSQIWISSAICWAAYLALAVLPSNFPSCRALKWETLSRSIPRFLSCDNSSVVNATAVISPVGIK